MSPLWRDQLRIALAPHQVTLLRISRSWRPRVAEKHVFPCSSDNLGNTPWKNALTMLGTILPEFTKKPSDTLVILSNHFARYALIPYSDNISSKAEDLALMRHYFTSIYGEAVDSWVLRLSDDGHSDNRVACAIDQALLDSVSKLFQTGKSRLTSIQPYLMAAFNQWHNSLAGTALFVLIEPGRLCLATFRDRQWYAIKNSRMDDDAHQDLLTILLREKLLSGIDAAAANNVPVFVVSSDQIGLDKVQLTEHSIQLLSARSDIKKPDANEIAHIMAMTG